MYQHVPIPTIDIKCRKTCCTRTLLPLQVAYARTIHTFQGLAAGPTPSGEPTQYQCIVCDPDDRFFEGKNLGLFYTAVSRATTLGDDTGLNSAIYFTGTTFNQDRIRNLDTKMGSVDLFDLAAKRKAWVNYLKERTRSNEFSDAECDDILQWAATHQSDRTILLTTIHAYVQQLTHSM